MYKFSVLCFVSAFCFMTTESFASSWACSDYECAFCDDDRAFCLNDGSCLCVDPDCGCTKEGCLCMGDCGIGYYPDCYGSGCNCSECSDESCCTSTGGSWATDGWGDNYICCAEGTPMCAEEEGDCICVPDGYDSDCETECIICSPTEGTAKCSWDGDCICVPEGYSSDCGGGSCIACSPAEGKPVCSDSGECICVPEGYSGACGYTECKVCYPTEGTAKCPQYEDDCICVPSGYSSMCNEENCVACPSGSVATCDDDVDGDCFCQEDASDSEFSSCEDEDCCYELGGEWATNDEGTEYICCAKYARCAEFGGCICVPEGYRSTCDSDNCIACPSGKTPTCDGDGYCECV